MQEQIDLTQELKTPQVQFSRPEFVQINEIIRQKKLSKEQTKVIEKMVLCLNQEKQNRLKSEEQNSQMIEQLVHNQAKLEQQLKMVKERPVSHGSFISARNAFANQPLAFKDESPMIEEFSDSVRSPKIDNKN